MANKAPKFVKFKNVSKHRLVNEDLGVDARPGEECMIQEGYAFPRRSNAGGRFPSVLEQLFNCPGCPEKTNGKLPDGEANHEPHCLLRPVDEADAERFDKTPDVAPTPHVKQRMPTVNDFVAQGVPKGVAEQLVKAAIASAQAAKDGDLLVSPEPEAPKKPSK